MGRFFQAFVLFFVLDRIGFGLKLYGLNGLILCLSASEKNLYARVSVLRGEDLLIIF